MHADLQSNPTSESNQYIPAFLDEYREATGRVPVLHFNQARRLLLVDVHYTKWVEEHTKAKPAYENFSEFLKDNK